MEILRWQNMMSYEGAQQQLNSLQSFSTWNTWRLHTAHARPSGILSALLSCDKRISWLFCVHVVCKTVVWTCAIGSFVKTSVAPVHEWVNADMMCFRVKDDQNAALIRLVICVCLHKQERELTCHTTKITKSPGRQSSLVTKTKENKIVKSIIKLKKKKD